MIAQLAEVSAVDRFRGLRARRGVTATRRALLDADPAELADLADQLTAGMRAALSGGGCSTRERVRRARLVAELLELDRAFRHDHAHGALTAHPGHRCRDREVPGTGS